MTAPIQEEGPAGVETRRTHCYAKTASEIVRPAPAKECQA